ncbi:hypothetical protein SO802_009259 [Lithocarpus litseifolius]|uniref:Uncharacterized protein n=1 Tax=Lithocarpus litseifolius TaxID=425828 RepID=A0AAW2DD26_9ROSI
MYSSGTPRIPLEVFQEETRRRAASGSSVGPSAAPPPSIPPLPRQTKDVLVCCAMKIPSKIDGKRLLKLKDKYQIPDEVHTHLPTSSEWCCTPKFPGVGIYEAYLLGGLRLPLNAFARELLYRFWAGDLVEVGRDTFPPYVGAMGHLHSEKAWGLGLFPTGEAFQSKNLAEELRTDIVKKESHLDHLQKKSDKLSSSLSKSKDKAIKEFKISDAYTKLLDENYATGFEDFC